VAAGIVMLFVLCIVGVISFKDRWFKVAAFGVGGICVMALWGVDFASELNGLSTTVNGAGFVASFIALAFVPLAPTKGMKQTAAMLGGGTLVASLMGFPSWILWVMLAAVLVGLMVLGYKLVSKALGGILREIHPNGQGDTPNLFWVETVRSHFEERMVRGLGVI